MVSGRARAARLGPVLPATGKGQEGKDRPLECAKWQAAGAGKRAASPGRSRRAPYSPSPPRPRRRSSGDCELKHFLEKSLVGGACAL